MTTAKKAVRKILQPVTPEPKPETQTVKVKGPSGPIEILIDYPYGTMRKPRVRVLAMVERIDPKKGTPMETLGYTASVTLRADGIVDICHDDIRYTPCKPYRGRDKEALCRLLAEECEEAIVTSPEATSTILASYVRDAEVDLHHAEDNLKRYTRFHEDAKAGLRRAKSMTKLKRIKMASSDNTTTAVAKHKGWFN